MTPQRFVAWAIGVLGVALLGLISVVWSYNTGVDGKQDVRLETLEGKRADADADMKLVQYKMEQMNVKVDSVDRKVEAMDNKVDEIVNRLRREFPTQP